MFASPVQISANTTYVVSYYDPDGHYCTRSGTVRLAAEHAPADRGEGRLRGTPAAATASSIRRAGFPTLTIDSCELCGRRHLRHDAAAGPPPSVTSVDA